MTNALASTLPDASERARALDVTKSFIVQAPAGSGKTELLTQRYLRLLASVARPEQILAITFTRKAASEMRNRILKALHEAQTQPQPTEPHRLLTWDLARVACTQDRERGWELLSHPARLRIQTIDALNMSIARRLPILSGSGANLSIATDTAPLYEGACLRLIERLGDGSSAALSLETVLLHLGNRVDSLIELLGDLLRRRDHWLPIVIGQPDAQALRASIEATLAEIVTRHLRQLRAAIPGALHTELARLVAYSVENRLREYPDKALDAALLACRGLDELPRADAAALQIWRGIVQVCLKSDGEFYFSLTKAQGFPTTDRTAREHMLAALEQLRSISGAEMLFGDVLDLPTPQYEAAQWQVLESLLGILPLAVAELKLQFQERGQVDYVESSLRALDALGAADSPTDVALALDDRLAHILVDEFQDTSFTQLELLNRLTAGWTSDDGRTLFCVGDPMQSIYRFREAEVGLFLELQARGLPNVAMQALKLAVNFRSTRPLLQWINAAFPTVLPAVNDAEQGAVSFSASEPQPDAGDEGAVHIHPGIERNQAAEAQLVMQLTRAALAEDGKGTVAILVANRSHVGAIATTLASNAIAFQAVEIERLHERPVVQDLVALTRALVHVGDRVAWLSVLRAPWCGLTLPDLHALAADSADTVWALLSNNAIRSEEGQQRLDRIAPILAATLAERGRYTLRDWIERCWHSLGGPATLSSAQDLDDAAAFFSRLEELDEGADLADVARLDQQLEDLFARPQSDGECRVEIMTLHKSKGLEFDTVILPSLERGGGRDTDKLLRWARVAGLQSQGLLLAPTTATGAETDPIYHWLKRWELKRAAFERGRQLYVAATRARKHLHLLGNVGVTTAKEGVNLKRPKSGTLLALLWPSVADHFANALQHAAGNSKVSSAAPAPLMLRRLPLQWQLPQPQAAVAFTAQGVAVTINPEQPEFDWVGETSRHIGTVVHRELERLAQAGPAQSSNWEASQRRVQFTNELIELGVPERYRATACGRALTAVANTLDDPRGRWILGVNEAQQEAHSELALSGVIDGEVRNIVIDRSFVTAGTRWIVDFKTSSHEGGGLDEFLASEVERYRVQLQRYAKLMRGYRPNEPIKAALYFPLLKAWCEVAV
jgi:ATP-dependent helicase/nuclease subunit A